MIQRDIQDSLDQILGKVRCESVSSQSDKDTGAILYIEDHRRDVSSARAAMDSSEGFMAGKLKYTLDYAFVKSVERDYKNFGLIYS